PGGPQAHLCGGRVDILGPPKRRPPSTLAIPTRHTIHLWVKSSVRRAIGGVSVGASV
ncbi:MAG: hypothetical protein QOC83_4291, partial [Pseudonocardiales bacterium]|nr:hypothetical protein [Pseudonocardiales bacterium]